MNRSRIKPKEVPEVPSFRWSDIDPVEFQKGYEHGLRSNTLLKFRLSFRMGFRQAKIDQQRAKLKPLH